MLDSEGLYKQKYFIHMLMIFMCNNNNNNKPFVYTDGEGPSVLSHHVAPLL